MALHNILRNSTYYGKVRSQGHLFDGQHEPIIDEALFRRVQSLKPDRTHARSRLNRVFLLKGLLRCEQCGSFMSPHYTQKRRKDGSVNRIPYYRCTKTMHFSNRSCTVRQLNAHQVERAVVEDLSELSQNRDYIEQTVAALNRSLKAQAAPLEEELTQVRKRQSEIDTEVDRFVKALGKGRLSIDRLEAEMAARESDRQALSARCDELQRQLNESVVRDYDADLVSRNLRDFRRSFSGLNPPEQAETLQCVLRSVGVNPGKLTLEIFELPGLTPGSQNHKDWLLT